MMVSFVCCFMFFSPTPNVFSPQPFSIKLQFCCRRRRPSLSPQGDNSSLPLSLVKKCHREAGSGEFVCCFYSPPPLPIFSHGSLFQLICYSVGRARRPPSVDKVNNSPPHPSPLASHVEKAVLASFPLLYIFLPTISNVFSLQPFSILLLCLWQCQLPSLSLEGK